MSDINIRRLKKVQDYLIQLDVLPIYEAECKSLPELYYMLAKKVNEIINSLEAYEVNISSITQDRLDKLDYVLTEGIYDEVGNIMEDLVDSGELNEIIKDKVFTELHNYMEEVTYIVKPPTDDVVADTLAIQEMLDKADGNTKVVLRFPVGEYNLNSLFIKENTTIEMCNKTVLRYSDTYINNKKLGILLMNAKAYEDEFLGYNGNGNITIKGGIIYAPSAMCLIHGENICIDNVTFKNSETDHVIQIGGCKNVCIKDCNFIGRKQGAESRLYTEMIQIDWVTAAAMPYWDETSNIFDHTVNDNIIIENCNFNIGTGDYSYLYTGIGSHSNDGEYKNKNIIIQKCKFNNFMYAGIVASRMENVIIRDNLFNTTTLADAIQVRDSDNAIIDNNNIINTKRLSYVTNSLNVKIINNTTKNAGESQSMIAVADSNELIINNNIFDNCTCTQAVMMLRGCKYIGVVNNIDKNCVSDIDTFARVYNTDDDNLSSNGIVKNNATPMTEVALVDGVSKIINNCKREVLWSGEIGVGETLTLNDDINKFEGLEITFNCYGYIKRALLFINGTFMYREVNLPGDDTDNLTVNFIECILTLNDKTISFDFEQCLLLNEGTLTSIPYNVKIRNISGYRKAY